MANDPIQRIKTQLLDELKRDKKKAAVLCVSLLVAVIVLGRLVLQKDMPSSAKAAPVAEARGIAIGLEPHQQYSQHPEGLDRIYQLVKSPAIGINFDTGNSYLCGHDPYVWLKHVLKRLVHLHAKDISVQQSSSERGKVTGTPVGCACGEGVIDWAKVIKICRQAKRDIVFSVECGTIDQAEKSLHHLRKLLAD